MGINAFALKVTMHQRLIRSLELSRNVPILMNVIKMYRLIIVTRMQSAKMTKEVIHVAAERVSSNPDLDMLVDVKISMNAMMCFLAINVI